MDRRHFLGGMGAAATAFALSSCSNGSSAGAPAGPAPTTITSASASARRPVVGSGAFNGGSSWDSWLVNGFTKWVRV